MAGMDFLVNFAATIASKLVCGAIHEGSYCCSFNNFIDDLKKEKKELRRYKERIDDRVRKAKDETKVVDNLVKQWLLEAEILEKEVSQLEEKAGKNKSCCSGYCPNLMYRYYLSKQLAKKKETIQQHYAKSYNFKEIARLASLPGMKYYSSENFIGFESRESAYEQLIKALEDDGVSMIGLYGMGGCGKTTLAKEVGKEAEQFFKKVIFVVVSSNEEVRKIQDRIASSLQFELGEKEEAERAKRLSMRLSKDNETILIILDDVWKRLDFEVIGIPFGQSCKGCKVLMTTRSFSVCNLMACHKTILLSLLPFNESWVLFQKYACITNETSNALRDLAIEITIKCNGLPIAIATVASTLKGKFQDEWEVALRTLKDSRPMNIEEGLQDPYTCLELSYNNLKSQEAKELFLLCSTFPEDWDIDIELLTRCGIGLGLFGRASSYIMARKQVNVAKNKLIDSCLLLEADEDGEHVKMHDLVRDVALWIANKENKVIMGREINELEEDVTIRDNRIRYICCNRFPNRLGCSKLEFLHVCTDSKQVQVPCEYFKGMKKLRVLVLENENIKDIPVTLNSIQKLTCLRCLVLIDWELVDISFIGCLKALESLTLKSCSIQKLPEAIEQLTKLRLLDISKCDIAINPYEVIGKYSHLEELYFSGNGSLEWEFDNETAFELLAKFSAPKQLQRFHIELGKREKEFNMADGSISRILSVEYFDAPTSSATIMDLVRKTEALSLGHIKGGYKNIIPDLFQRIGGMTELVKLVLHDSEEIKCLIDNTDHQYHAEDICSNLSNLWIERMEHLEALCYGHPSPGLFEKLENVSISQCSQLQGVLFARKLNLCSLKVLKIKECAKLSSIFTPDSARSLSQLQDLIVEGCHELEHIIIEDMNEDITKGDNQLEQIIADEEYQNIMNRCAESCTNIASNSCTLHSGSLNLCSLELLIVKDCPMLRYLFTLSTVRTLTSLEKLEVSKCHGLKEIIDSQSSYACKREETRFQSHVSVLFPKLNYLDIKYCNLLELIFPASCTQGIIGLKNISIHEAPQLRSLFTPSTARALISLESLGIKECHGLKEIITCESGHECITEEIIQNDSGLQSHDSVFPKLNSLDIEYCSLLECIFPISFTQGLMKLYFIRICEAPKLQYVFGEGKYGHHSSFQYRNMIEIKLPLVGDLILSELPNLISICPKNCYTSCPSLQSIQLDHVGLCNPMDTKSLRGGSKDRRSHYTSTMELGATIVENFASITVEISNSEESFIEKENGLPLMREMVLQNQHETDPLCFSPKCLLNLKNLLELTVDRCGNMKAMFSVCVLRSLPQLMELIIIECEELEKITIEDKGNESKSNPHPQKACFLQLRNLVIMRCNKLKHLFSVSTSREFPKLEYLIIKEAFLLEEVFESEKGETNEGKVLMLPELKCLMLVKLPSLTNVSEGIEFQTVTCCIVQNCPNLSLTTALRKPLKMLEREIESVIYDYAVAMELVCVLRITVRETLNKAAPGSRPPPSQNIKGVTGEETVGNDNASKPPAIASSSTDSELRIASPISSSVLSHNIEVAETERAQKNLILDGAGIATCMNDLAPSNSPLAVSSVTDAQQMASSLEPMKRDSISKTITMDQLELGETGSNKRFKDLTKEVAQEGIPVVKANTTSCSTDLETVNSTLLYKSSPQDQQEASRETKVSVEGPEETSKPSNHALEAMVKKSSLKDHALEEAVTVTLSDDFATRNLPPTGSLVTDSQQKELMNNMSRSDMIMTHQTPFAETRSSMQYDASQNGVTKGVQDGLLTGKAKTVTSSQLVMANKDDSVSKAILKEQSIWQNESSNDTPNLPSDHVQAVLEPETDAVSKEELKKTELTTKMSSTECFMIHKHALEETGSNVVTEGTQEGLPTVKVNTVAPTPQVMVNKDELCKSIVKEQAIWKSESTSDTPNLPSRHAQNVLKFETHGISKAELKKTSMESSLVVPKLKGSSRYPSYASSDRTFSQISPNPALSPFSSTSRNLLGEPSTRVGVDKFTLSPKFSILQPNLLQELKTKLAEYFNMPLEDVLTANAFEEVEKTVNSLAGLTTDVIQKNILEDFSNRLKYFKECVPKAMSNVQSSSEFISNYESLNVELNTNMSEGKEILRDLECKLSETCEEEYAIDMEIQQLITRKMEILAQKNSLASQFNQITEAISKDYAKWKALQEELKPSTEKWLKSKEDLAHANASWKLFKESLGF